MSKNRKNAHMSKNDAKNMDKREKVKWSKCNKNH